MKLQKSNPVIRFVNNGVKFTKLPPSLFKFDFTMNNLTLNDHKTVLDSFSAVIYRSQVTKDEDWYEILDELSGFRVSSFISLGDDFEKQIYEK